MTKQQLRRRMIRNFARTKNEMQQLIRDVQWWNSNRLDAPPEDCEAEQIYLAAVAGLPDDPSTWDEQQRQKHETATSAYGLAIRDAA